MNLVLIDAAEIEPAGETVLSGHRATHVIDILRAAAGDTIRVGIVDGPVGTGTVLAVDASSVRLRCAFEPNIPPPPVVDLLLALPRPKVMRRLWAQLASMGVGRIILTNAERVERDYFDTHTLKEEFYRPLLIEGLQQARDTRLPRVSIHRRFRVLIEDELDALSADGLRLVAHPGEPLRVHEAIARERPSRVLIAVGPEGGWNAFELEMLLAHGFIPVGVGARTLRTDTACISLLAVAHDAMLVVNRD